MPTVDHVLKAEEQRRKAERDAAEADERPGLVEKIAYPTIAGVIILAFFAALRLL